METATDTPNSTSTNIPPYFAFRTLLNTLEDMRKRGIPNRIDRTYLSGMSGAGQTQFIAGLRSLGLIDGAGNVSDELRQLVEGSPTDRQRVLGEVLQRRYPEAVELGKTNATTGQLVEVFRGYGAQGDTARKAIAFYLQAAKFAGDIPLSPMFQTPKVTAATGTPRKKRRTGVTAKSTNPDADDTQNDREDAGFPQFHQILAGVLSEFPAYPRGWTLSRRDEVMKMFEMAVDFTIPVKSDDEVEAEEIELEQEEVDLQE